MPRTRYLNKKSLPEALHLFVEAFPIRLPEAETIAVEAALNRITAAPICARISAPHYHGAAMDGIAVRAADTFGATEKTPVALSRARAAATDGFPETERPFQYVDTGNPLPPWANAVIMVEHVYPVDDDRLTIRAAAAPWQHVRLVGEDIVATEPLLPRGHRIRAFDIGALLAAGHVEVPVARRPRVAIVATGSELIEPGEVAAPGNVIEFNSRMIAAFVSQWGGAPERLPPVPDQLDAIADALVRATRTHDVVVIIAGSSAGERDFTVHAVSRHGRVLVHGIDIMPGKPAICAEAGGRPVLGVPGYPVSAAVVCQQVLRPLIARLLGVVPEPPTIVHAVVPRKIPSKLGLEEFLRVTLGRVGGRLVANALPRGAGVITTMVKADGLLRIPSLCEGINAGDTAPVELLRPASEIENTIVFSGSHDLTVGVLEDALKRRDPSLKISATNVGSLGGLLALGRGEAHVAGTHLLDPRSGQYNLPDIARHLRSLPVTIVNLVAREQGLIVAAGNPKGIRGVPDLTRGDVTFVNRQPGAGTRVLFDYNLAKLNIQPASINGYEREEFTHMAVAAAVASGLADCGLGIKSAATALNLDFVPVAREDYDLVLRQDFAASALGQELLAVIGSAAFRAAVSKLAGYHTGRTGQTKSLPAARKRVAAAPRGMVKTGIRGRVAAPAHAHQRRAATAPQRRKR